MILLGDEGDGAVDSSRRPCLHVEPIPPRRLVVAHVTNCDETVTNSVVAANADGRLLEKRCKTALGAGDCGANFPGRVDVVRACSGAGGVYLSFTCAAVVDGQIAE